ncbi:MAG: hypothetical protein ACI8ZM_000144 [Crocinitomix sp.]|jgi:hypothetical protein
MKTDFQLKGIRRNLPLFFGMVLFQCLISCEYTQGPEMVVRDWLAYRSAGECERAIDLECYSGEESRVILNCEPYESEIIGLWCGTTEETSSCSCLESRGLSQEKHYEFDLKKIDGEWKIAGGF